jgi:hypothetical protein
MSLDSFEPLDDDFNPYAAPKAQAAPMRLRGEVGQAEEIRRAYINHEAGFKSIGALYILGGVFGTIAVIAMIAVLASGQMKGMEPGVAVFVLAFYLVITALNYAIGIGLNKLQVWARWTALVFSVLGLIGVCLNALVVTFANPIAGLFFLLIGGGITGYILYLLASSKATYICSPEYREIIALTPHVKYRTPWWVWLVAILFVLGIVVAIIAAMMNRPGM